jgi:large subunit ribosomal protein L4
MVSLTVYDRAGSEVGKVDIDPADIAPRVNRQLLHDAVVMYQANRRQGSAKTKSRSEVSGSTHKMYRQKGTGNARAGSRRSGLRRGGGRIFAHRPRDYSYRLPRKAVRLATRMAIASKFRDDEVVVIDALAFDQPATKDMAAILKALGLQETTTLVTTAEHNANVYKSVRNIQGVTAAPLGDLNALSVLTPHKMLFTLEAVEALKSKSVEGGDASS